MRHSTWPPRSRRRNVNRPPTSVAQPITNARSPVNWSSDHCEWRSPAAADRRHRSMQVTVKVNGEEYTREIEPRLLLVHFLRDELGLTGTHWGCDTSNCGVCVVQVDGTPVTSCTMLAAMDSGHEVLTVEGLEQGGELDP